MLGVRELLHGPGILGESGHGPNLRAGVHARVGGDLLGVAAKHTRHPLRFAKVAAAVLAIGALDLVAACRLERHP